jgi:hypothetical protein
MAAAPNGWANAEVDRNVTTEARVVIRPSFFEVDIREAPSG